MKKAPELEIAENVVKAILRDLRDRRGLRQGWDGIEVAIREEIISSWESLVLDEMTKTLGEEDEEG